MEYSGSKSGGCSPCASTLQFLSPSPHPDLLNLDLFVLSDLLKGVKIFFISFCEIPIPVSETEISYVCSSMGEHLRTTCPLTVNLSELESRLKIIYLILYSSLLICLSGGHLFTKISSICFIPALILKLSIQS
jgi:hypothetical protein